MSNPTEEPAVNGQRETVEPLRVRPSETSQSPGAKPSSAQLHDAPPGSPVATEWNFYRRIIGRLLEDGHEGKWLLIREEELVGIWPTLAEANTVRLERYPQQPVLMKQILTQEPILRIGYNRLCRS